MPSIIRHDFTPDPDGRKDVLGNPRCTCGRSQSAPEHKPAPTHQSPAWVDMGEYPADEFDAYHGPFFDFTERHKWLMRKRDTCARLCAEDTMKGNLGSARGWAADYQRMEDALDALELWWEDWQETPARWVGFTAYTRR